MLTFIIAEAALETVPKELWNHAAVRRNSKRHKKPPKQLLLDRSLHHAAMRQLEDNLKRGRPDITHFVLLEALGSPLNKEGLLQVYVHTNQNYVITVNPTVRLPRNYTRFVGLIEQLFEQGKAPSDGEPLLTLEHKTLQQLLSETKPDYILAFTKKGKPKTIQNAVSNLQSKQNPAVIIGGFAHGSFSETTTQLLDEIVCVDLEMLEAWTVASRAIYEFERALSLPMKRLGRQ
ncbi:MAG: 16S rRNA methyltransferase [Candidatus Bathyarchaeota archaeon]|nr:16S rRNA methyltransferase [Candidatus Bathyarchaeum sp.]